MSALVSGHDARRALYSGAPERMSVWRANRGLLAGFAAAAGEEDFCGAEFALASAGWSSWVSGRVVDDDARGRMDRRMGEVWNAGRGFVELLGCDGDAWRAAMRLSGAGFYLE